MDDIPDESLFDMRHSYAHAIIFAVLPVSLAGCLGTTEVATQADPPVGVALAASNATEANPAVFQATGARGTMVYSSSNFDTNTATLTPAADTAVQVEISPDPVEGWEVRLLYLGKDVPFLPSWLQSNGIVFEAVHGTTNEEIYLWAYDATWLDILNGNSPYQHLVRVGTALYDPATLTNERTFAVLGVETEIMPTSGTVSYVGTVNGDYVVDGNISTYFSGNAGIDVSFGEPAMITGQVNDIYVGDVYQEVVYLIDDTSFSGSSFNAPVMVDTQSCGTACPTQVSGSVDGQFFGPDASEVGGTFTVTGTLPDMAGDFTAIGVWAGSEVVN